MHTLGKNMLECTKWNTDCCWRYLPSPNTTVLRQLQESSLSKLFTPSLQIPWWLIQGKTEIINDITCSPKRNSNSALKKILTNLEELSFLTVLAFPKAGENRKTNMTNLSVKKYLNAKISMTVYIFKGITDFWEKIPCSLYGYQSLRTDGVWQTWSEMRKHLWKPKEVSSQRFLCLKKWKKNIQGEMVPRQTCTWIKPISLEFESSNLKFYYPNNFKYRKYFFLFNAEKEMNLGSQNWRW